jgi:excisionase family DNA binding protein
MRRAAGTRYSVEQECLIVDHITLWRKETIARRLGKSRSAVRAWCWRHGINARSRHLMTSGQAAKYVNRSCQWLTELARSGRIKARREPGGRWWLFSADTLDRFFGGSHAE